MIGGSAAAAAAAVEVASEVAAVEVASAAAVVEVASAATVEEVASAAAIEVVPLPLTPTPPLLVRLFNFLPMPVAENFTTWSIAIDWFYFRECEGGSGKQQGENATVTHHGGPPNRLGGPP